MKHINLPESSHNMRTSFIVTECKEDQTLGNHFELDIVTDQIQHDELVGIQYKALLQRRRSERAMWRDSVIVPNGS